LHVTLLFPFVPRGRLDENAIGDLEEFFSARTRLTLTLTGLGEFPGVVYAVPEPEAELREWIDRLCERFPEFPPYGGEFAEVVPHATLGTVDGPERHEALVARARELTPGLFPLAVAVEDVALLEEHEPDRWRELRRFPLGVS
jgi:2'-5' RNA ligase